MLYEVITTDPFTILSDYIVDVEDSDVKTIEITNAEKVLRITSYNVCYTKLLRNWS